MTVSSFTFQNAIGKVAQLHYEAYNLGSPRGLVVVVIDRSSAQDADLETATTLTGLLATVANEVTNSGYARHNITAAGAGQLALPSISYDVGNSRMPGDFPDQVYTTVLGGDLWTDTIVCYAPDTGGADTTFIPLTCNHSPITPSGSTITLPVNLYWSGARP